MVYKVKKRIKGRLYLYEQRSWREGGKVKTHSRYLGPCGAGDGPAAVTGDAAREAPKRALASPLTLHEGNSEPRKKRAFKPRNRNAEPVVLEAVNTTLPKMSVWQRLSVWNSLRKNAHGWRWAQKTVAHYAKNTRAERFDLLEKWSDRIELADHNAKKYKRAKNRKYWRGERKFAKDEHAKLLQAIRLLDHAKK